MSEDQNYDARIDAGRAHGDISDFAMDVIRDLIEDLRVAEMAASEAECQVALLRSQVADYPAMAVRVANLTQRWQRWMPTVALTKEVAKVMRVRDVPSFGELHAVCAGLTTVVERAVDDEAKSSGITKEPE